MNYGFRNRLSYQQARNTILVALLLGLVMSVMQVALDVTKERKQVDATITQFLRVIKDPAAQAAYQLDGWLAKNVVEGLMEYQAIQEARLIDNFGTTLAEKSKPIKTGFLKDLAAFFFGRKVEYSQPLFHRFELEPVGELRIKIDTYRIGANFINRTGVTIIGGIIRDFAIAFLLTMLFYYFITRPLQRIVRELSSVNPLEPDKLMIKVPDRHDKDEMGLLVRSINNLLIGFGRSLDMRKRAEFEILDRETRIRTIMENVPDGIITVNQFGVIETFNPAALTIFNAQPHELEGMMLSNLFIGSYRHIIDNQLASISEQTEHNYFKPELIEAQAAAGNTQIINVELRFSSIKLDERLLIICVINDVTDRVKAQLEIRKMEEQLLQSQKMEAVGTLASGIAHDFNNLLQAISGYTQLILEDRQPDSRKQSHLSQIIKSVDRAGALVKRLLTFSRKVKPELKPIDLNKEVEQATTILERTIPKMIHIEKNFKKNLWGVLSDANQLEQVILNLGANARDAMPEGGVLTFQTENLTVENNSGPAIPGLQAGNYVKLSISDTGEGIDQEILDHIFEPFFTTKEIGEGTGLGLSTVYGIVSSHGGVILCDSKPGEGATFTIYLPALEKSAQIYDKKKTKPETSIRGKETILLVDDEYAIIEVSMEFMKRMGYSVFTAKSGEEALELFKMQADSIDLIVLDLDMPGMGGLKCLEEMLSINPEANIMIASGYHGEDRSQSVISLGAKGFIGKPYSLFEFAAAIREILGNSDVNDSFKHTVKHKN